MQLCDLMRKVFIFLYPPDDCMNNLNWKTAHQRYKLKGLISLAHKLDYKMVLLVHGLSCHESHC